ncbi:MAG TPA: pentapeptide repeat-containing protein, partial [Ktedonobacterales bacterium]|nr:pentapeptide repeat-containing protein [Ktedonobacterales bacterium]
MSAANTPTTEGAPPWPTGEPDNGVPAMERQAELRAAYEANVAAGLAPYEGVALRTRGELLWVLRERGWSGAFPTEQGKGRPNLSRALLNAVNLSGVTLNAANLSGADLRRANLSGVFLRGADLSDSYLRLANLSGAYLRFANLSGAFVREAYLNGADMRSVRMDVGTVLFGATLDSRTRLADVLWNGVPLTRLGWDDVRVIGDERIARDPRDEQGGKKDALTRLHDFDNAVLAYRQLATALRSQGQNEPADRFAYRAQVLRRSVLRRQAFLRDRRQRVRFARRLRSLTAFGGSMALDFIAGYGYKPLRSVWAYVTVILTFAAAYF